jgi:acyl-CoA thioesterase I
MVIIFISFGIQKFTPQSADGIALYISNSPLVSWLSIRQQSAIIAFGMLGVVPMAHADTVRIVAVGASNTAGKGVGTEAFPAQLEALLKAKGYDVRVTNVGISGDDTGHMLARIENAVPDGTRVVILDKAATNDRQRGITTSANISR